MATDKHRMSISMDEQMHEALLELRCRPEYRNMSIGALIRMMIERGLEEEDRNADAEERT